jgi:hypothetical protein
MRKTAAEIPIPKAVGERNRIPSPPVVTWINKAPPTETRIAQKHAFAPGLLEYSPATRGTKRATESKL